MVKLAYYSQNDFQQLIEWIPDVTFALQWGGPAFTYPITVEQLEYYLEGANEPNASTYIFKVIDDFTDEVIGRVSLGDIDRKYDSARIGKVIVGSAIVEGKAMEHNLYKPS